MDNRCPWPIVYEIDKTRLFLKKQEKEPLPLLYQAKKSFFDLNEDSLSMYHSSKSQIPLFILEWK